MEKLPTAEGFLPKNENGKYSRNEVETAMIEFAKLHVTQALKQASENAYYRDSDGFILRSEENRKSILNSYQLNNIK